MKLILQGLLCKFQVFFFHLDKPIANLLNLYKVLFKLLIDEDDEDLGDVFETAKPAVPDQHDMVRKRREDEGMKEG